MIQEKLLIKEASFYFSAFSITLLILNQRSSLNLLMLFFFSERMTSFLLHKENNLNTALGRRQLVEIGEKGGRGRRCDGILDIF